jgi:hypothetical protein
MIYLEKIITTYNLERNKLRKNNNNLIFIQVGKRNIYRFHVKHNWLKQNKINKNYEKLIVWSPNECKEKKDMGRKHNASLPGSNRCVIHILVQVSVMIYSTYVLFSQKKLKTKIIYSAGAAKPWS